MRYAAAAAAGLVTAPWLVLAASTTPATPHQRGAAAYARGDYAAAVQHLARAAALEPDSAAIHYLHAGALAQLGQHAAAAEASQAALVHARDPAMPPAPAGADEGPPAPSPGDAASVPVTAALGVWIVEARVNGRHAGRFLLDTGSSVTVLAADFAARVGARPGAEAPVELHTLTGRALAPSARVASLRVGDAELRDAPVVLHDPGLGLDGILGNTFLGHYLVTLDAAERRLHLRRVEPGKPRVASRARE
jgi:clan AA aspartic protease (TIGR02281 family)